NNVRFENWNRVSFPNSVDREFAQSIVPSPPGRDLLFVLKDSVGNSSGTFGQWKWHAQDGNRTLVMWMDKSGRIILRGMQIADGKNTTVSTFVKDGAPSDADMDNPADGAMVADSAGNKLWIRIGGKWKSVGLT